MIGVCGFLNSKHMMVPSFIISNSILVIFTIVIIHTQKVKTKAYMSIASMVAGDELEGWDCCCGV